MKIAILAFHFKPDEAIGSVRPENWAKWLAESHEVVVVTREMVCADDTEVQGYRILRPPSAITRLIDRANTWRKNRRNRGANRRAMSSRTVPEVSKSTSGAFVYRMPCLCDLWFSACYRALRRERPDVVIATHSPYISLIAAWVYATMNSRTKLWLDFRDLWTASHLASGVPFLRGIERLLEARALSRADMVSTVSQGLRESFLGKVTNGNVAVIYNAQRTPRLSAGMRN